MCSRYILTALLLLSELTVIAQKDVNVPDFKQVDSFILTVKYKNDINLLARELTDPYNEDLYKVRAIFKWITENIAWDYRFMNKGDELNKPECTSDINCGPMLRLWENNYLKKILRTKKAIAYGYAKLFKRLCDLSYVQSLVVGGYARTKPYQIGNRMSENHFWNAVALDGIWYFCDPTWAAGYCPEDEEGLLLKYVRSYHNYYWLSGFTKMFRNHYPKNGHWAEQAAYSKEQFFNLPHYYSIDVLENIFDEYPATGVLHFKKGDTIHFSFGYKKEICSIQVNTNLYHNPPLFITEQVRGKKTRMVHDPWAEKRQQYVPFKRTGNIYEFGLPVSDESLYYVDLVFDHLL